MRTFSFDLSPPNQAGNAIITEVPNLLRPLRGPVVLGQNMPRESVRLAGIHRLIINDVILVTLEVILKQ
jgi:hypothetical protein